MFIVMKGHLVEITVNHDVSRVRLESIGDALTYVEVMKKVSFRRDLSTLPANYAYALRDHLERKGRIGKKKRNLASRASLYEKALILSSLCNEKTGGSFA